MSPEILHETMDIIVVHKPSGMLTIPDRYNPLLENLSDILRERYDELFVVHRIDRETSGVVVFARHAQSHRYLNGLFEHHQVKKEYRALVCGTTDEQGEIDLPIVEIKPGIMGINKREGKPSKTLYRRLESFGEYSLMEVTPLSGRTHQIRVHFKAIGHPLAVDSIYNPDGSIYLSHFKKRYKHTKGMDEKPIISRLTLHANSIEFLSPQGENLRFEAPLPKDFSGVLKQLRKWT